MRPAGAARAGGIGAGGKDQVKVRRFYSHGSKTILDVAEALLAYWQDLDAFEHGIKALFSNVDIYIGHTHRRYTLFGRDDHGNLRTDTSVYLEL
jgi:hypothetical protein